MVALEEAAVAVSRRHDVRMLSLSGLVLWRVLRGHFTGKLEESLGRPLTEAERESLRGDAHGGMWETSLMLLARPDLVDATFSTLPPQRFSLLEAMKRNYPLRLGNKTGYIGSPASATAEFGEAARVLLTEAAWEIARPVFEAADDTWQRTSMLYKIPFMRTAFPYVASGFLLLLAGFAVWKWFV